MEYRVGMQITYKNKQDFINMVGAGEKILKDAFKNGVAVITAIDDGDLHLARIANNHTEVALCLWKRELDQVKPVGFNIPNLDTSTLYIDLSHIQLGNLQEDLKEKLRELAKGYIVPLNVHFSY